MSDRDELRTLVERYAASVDARAFDRLADVFVAEGVLVTGNGTRTGLAAIQEAMAGLHRYSSTDHRVSAAAFAVDHDTATGRVECDAHHLHVVDGVGTDRVMTITYHDTYGRTPDGWRIERRRLEIHAVEDVVLD